ncbi:hypothetical protein TNCT_32841 [Trichonephila clavata]|uniref:Uncharacterized protein n=1 Tax=Trichonephila clavata TaxID=2740835 RepID=A0A8X6FUJ4_TRICU|nr:hypothetical protein TNCT_32841 [Trichonephila clavata]
MYPESQKLKSSCLVQQTFSMTSRDYNYMPEEYCYVCGHFIKRVNKYSVKTSNKMCEVYRAYSGILAALKCDNHVWEIIGDFKVIGFLMDVQYVFIKFLVIFLFGTADILKCIIAYETSHR